MGVGNGRDWPVKLKQRCEDVGWTVTYTKSGHYKVQHPSGRLLFTFASSPTGAPYVEKNALAEARRHGLDKLEEATAQLRENERVLRIASDRADADAKLARIAASRRTDEPAEPASSEVDPAESFVDPSYDQRSGRTALRVAPSRDRVNGRTVVARQPATMQHPHDPSGFVRTDTITELLLDDGTTVNMCNSPRADDCRVWGRSVLSVRAHLRIHSKSAVLRRALELVKDERNELAQGIVRRKETAVSPGSVNGKHTGSVDPSRLTATIGGIMEQLNEAFAEIVVATANVQRQFQALNAELRKIDDIAVTDEETLAKARKYDQFKQLMQ